jgi:hypothetical protein
VADSTYREWEYGRAIRGIGAYEPLALAFQISLGELILGERGKASCVLQDLRDLEEIIKGIRIKL